MSSQAITETSGNCYYCQKQLSDKVTCLGCKVATYCNHGCEALHAEKHIPLCSSFKAERDPYFGLEPTPFLRELVASLNKKH